MTDKKIEPIDPNTVAARATDGAEAAERKTAGASGRFRRTAVARFGRKTNSARIF